MNIIQFFEPFLGTLEAYPTILAYGTPLSVFVIVWLVLRLCELGLVLKLKRLAEKTTNTVDDAVVTALTTLKSPFYFAVSFLAALRYTELPEKIEEPLIIFAALLITWQMMRAIRYFMNHVITLHIERLKKKRDKEHARVMMNLVRNVLLVLIWAVVILSLLANIGVNVTSLVASLGIGGIAIALALQNVLTDVFSSFSIFVDKPFQVGDYIALGDKSGTVKHIGLKTTRIATLRGEQLIVSNRELTSAQVQNFRSLQRRRDVMTFGVDYDTPQKVLADIPAMVEKIVSSEEHATFGRCHLHVLGDSSIDFELVYFVEAPEYDVYMDVRQAILMNILAQFEKKKISIAYPTQVVQLKK